MTHDTRTRAAVKEPFGEGREVVTIEAFNRFVEWFGPIKDAAPSGSASATTPEPTTQLFTRILTTLAQPYAFFHHHPGMLHSLHSSSECRVVRVRWFHGVLSSPEAEQKLTRGGVGSFLVRYSTRSPGAFSIHYVKGGTRSALQGALPRDSSWCATHNHLRVLFWAGQSRIFNGITNNTKGEGINVASDDQSLSYSTFARCDFATLHTHFLQKKRLTW